MVKLGYIRYNLPLYELRQCNDSYRVHAADQAFVLCGYKYSWQFRDIERLWNTNYLKCTPIWKKEKTERSFFG